MRLVKTKDSFNDYTWHGLTKGKLLAILHALKDQETDERLTIVQRDVLTFLQTYDLEIDYRG